MRRRNSDRFDISVCEREHYVAWRDLAHEVIERISPTIAIALGRPQIPAQHLVPVRLILVSSPVSHRLCRQIGRTNVSTPATNAHLVCSLLPEKQNQIESRDLSRVNHPHHTQTNIL